MISRRVLLLGSAGALGLAVPRSSAQEQYPSRPIRLIVPSAPGGVHDVIARFWGDAVKGSLRTVVIDNRGGAAGAIAVTEAARAEPDGYTLLLGSNSTHILQPLSSGNPAFDPLRDFSVSCLFAATATAVAVHPDIPATTLLELINYIKSTPGKLSYGHAGVGAVSHVTGEMFKRLAGTPDIAPVPYRGMGPAQADVISGKVSIFFPNVTGTIGELQRTRKLKVLAVNAATRHDTLPEIPTAEEAGLPGMISQSFFGIFAPAQAPARVLERVHQATFSALDEPSVRERLSSAGFEAMRPMPSREAAEYLKAEYLRWEPIAAAMRG